MGMRQRLAIAAALLGDPQVLILDEPNNGLDPPGIIWLRGLMREQAADGRTVLISSHVLAEVAQSVDDVVVIADGELRAHGPLEQVLGGDDGPATTVRAQDPVRLTRALERRGHRVDRDGDVLNVSGATRKRSAKSPATSSCPCSAWPPERAPSKKRSSLSLACSHDRAPASRAAQAPHHPHLRRGLASAAALSLTLVVLGAVLGKQTKPHALFTNSAITYIIVILGAIAMTGEWRHRTITGSVLAAPNRVRLLAAKAISYSVAGIALAIIVTVPTIIVGELAPQAAG